MGIINIYKVDIEGWKKKEMKSDHQHGIKKKRKKTRSRLRQSDGDCGGVVTVSQTRFSAVLTSYVDLSIYSITTMKRSEMLYIGGHADSDLVQHQD